MVKIRQALRDRKKTSKKTRKKTSKKTQNEERVVRPGKEVSTKWLHDSESRRRTSRRGSEGREERITNNKRITSSTCSELLDPISVHQYSTPTKTNVDKDMKKVLNLCKNLSPWGIFLSEAANKNTSDSRFASYCNMLIRFTSQRPFSAALSRVESNL